MASNSETLLVEQMKELSRDLNALSLQLRSLELAQDASKTCCHLAMPPKDHDHEDIETLCTVGYVNWGSTHDSLKTAQWKKMSEFTEFCGKLERGVLPDFYLSIDLSDINVVDEETRFPKDDIYVNVSNPLVRTEILYIKELQAMIPETGLVERFLNVAKGDMHTLNSFEKKYRLKWVEPSPKMEVPVQKPTATSDNGSILKPVSQDEDPWNLPEDAEPEKVDSDRTPTTLAHKQSEDELDTHKLIIWFEDFLVESTPQNFKTLMKDIVQTLNINTQKQMEVVANVLFERVLDEPSSAHICATLCSKLAKLKVPSDNNPDKYITFKGLIIRKCQTHFETGKSDKQNKMENDLEDTNDPSTKLNDELQIMKDGINTTTQMRAKANVKFMGELYKLKMLTHKIIDYCMRNLIDDSNEQKLVCLCQLLVTAGKELENESKSTLDGIFEKLQEIVDYKSEKISSDIHSMIQDVIDLRTKRWVVKKVTACPKTMQEIQDETNKRELLIKLMNEFGMGGRSGGAEDDGAMIRQGKDKHSDRTCYTVDALKREAATQETLNYIKLPPKCFEYLQENMYSVLEKLQVESTSHRNSLTVLDNITFTSHSNISLKKKNALNLKVPFNLASSSSSHQPTDLARTVKSMITLKKENALNLKVPFNLASSSSSSSHQPIDLARTVKSMISSSLINPNNEELVAEVKQQFPPQFHATVTDEIIKVAIDKPIREVKMIGRSLNYLVATNTIAQENFIAGLKPTFEVAHELIIDVPMLYDYLGKLLAPHIKNNHITLGKVFDLSKNIVSVKQGHLLLKSIIECLHKHMGKALLMNKCQESGLKLSQWMSEELVLEWMYDNDLEFLDEFM